MPKLLVFAPCERVAVSDDTSTSLLGILQGFSVAAEAAADPTTEGIISLPMKWDIAALWYFSDEEIQVSYEIFCELKSPSGKMSFQGKLPLDAHTTFQRNTFHISGFPIGEAGIYTVTIFLAAIGKERHEIASYPIQVSHIPGEELLKQLRINNPPPPARYIPQS